MEMIQRRVNQSWLAGWTGVSRSSLSRWQIHGPQQKPKRTAGNALSSAERQEILDLLRSDEFIEDTPYQVVSKLLDRGKWLCSISTMYRVLHDAKEVRDRRDQRRHPKYHKPIIQATAPNQLWSWDITRLPGEMKGKYYFLYVMIDVFSRYVVGWMITHEENSERAQHFIRETVRQQGIQESNRLTIHSDRGSPMKASNTIELLAVLGLAQSFARPRISDDNPFSEAQFKTMKYHRYFKPWYESAEEAKAILGEFFKWYNGEHRHINLGLMTPETVHLGKVEEVLAARSQALRLAYSRHPERFSKRGPKVLIPQERVGINIPVTRQSKYVLE
jgi:putative transposase